MVDNTFMVPGYECVWSGGDCAAVPHVLGGTCPPVGVFALKHGEHIGRNILRVLQGQKPKPFLWPGLGQGVSIGRRTAVAEMKGIEFTGLLCWLVWRAMTFYYCPSWDRRLRLLSDWLIWPLVGRDIVEQSVNDNDDYEISHDIFQPNEVILQAGEVNRYIYLITEGEVDLLQAEPDGTESHTVLGPGAHFGNTSRSRRVQATVRARTLVRAVTVRADQASHLKQVLAPLHGVAVSNRS